MAAGTAHVLDSHLAAFGSGNVDAILANFADDAILVTPDNSYEFASDTFVARDGRIVAQTVAMKKKSKR